MKEIEKAIEVMKETLKMQKSALGGLPTNYQPMAKINEDIKATELAIKALEAQQANKWIPVSERLPRKYGTYMVAWRPIGDSAENIKIKTCSNLTHFHEILEYDPNEDDGWIESIKQCDAYVILAWRELPEPWKEEQL